jgi:hypothetical protein
MRHAVIAFLTLLIGATTAAHAAEPLGAFKQRIEAALAKADESGRRAAVSDLFHRGELDEWSASMAATTTAAIAALRGRSITFESLSADHKDRHVVDGYEYRPNVEPIGYAVFTDPAAAPGNNTRVLYGRTPDSDRLVFPLVVRTVVNADAAPDKALQMIAIGMAAEPVTFDGWCDIALSDGTTERVTLSDSGAGNQTQVVRGQSIEACEIVNTAGRGSLTLRLMEDQATVFTAAVEAPETRLAFRRE